jgi:hypothetical protein
MNLKQKMTDEQLTDRRVQFLANLDRRGWELLRDGT